VAGVPAETGWPMAVLLTACDSPPPCPRSLGRLSREKLLTPYPQRRLRSSDAGAAEARLDGDGRAVKPDERKTADAWPREQGRLRVQFVMAMVPALYLRRQV